MKQERSMLAGGCFWGMQDLIRKRDGVISTRVGYSGGDVPNATYRHHGTHAEAIEIVFDPERLSFRELLEFFFQVHDPTTRNRQGNDVGTSYRSAIFTTSDEQRRIAEDTIADVNASGLWPGRVMTEVAPADPSGKRSRNTRITWSVSQTDTHAISSDRGGSCQYETRHAQAPGRPCEAAHGRALPIVSIKSRWFRLLVTYPR
jgi:peptide-methionine (S)-S-oxide reductase